jgi:metal iron transporter
MNCPSGTDNQDSQNFNGRTNSPILSTLDPAAGRNHEAEWMGVETALEADSHSLTELQGRRSLLHTDTQEPDFTSSSPARPSSFLQKARKWIKNYSQFIGPGFMVRWDICGTAYSINSLADFLQISVAYIDPGNYSTDVAAGASYQFKLLFIILVSNIIAIYLQSLCIKLGTITGMDLAQMSRAHLPRWLNIFLYLMAEGAVRTKTIPAMILANLFDQDYRYRHC